MASFWFDRAVKFQNSNGRSGKVLGVFFIHCQGGLVSRSILLKKKKSILVFVSAFVSFIFRVCSVLLI